mmetsp:Transcript_26444/g.54535  ORF Transcript_26444/g.54535 Transcript_26444/m.54535 type:complete len:296 (+) Transcript_26444:138-1025(+)
MVSSTKIILCLLALLGSGADAFVPVSPVGAEIPTTATSSGYSLVQPGAATDSALFGIISGKAVFGAVKNGIGGLFKYKLERQQILLESVETAMALSVKKRRDEWLEGVIKKFPFLPADLLHKIVHGLDEAFMKIAPEDVRTAVQPGGREKMKKKIEMDIVNHIESRPLIKRLPIPKKDKDQVLMWLVDKSVDKILGDLEEHFESPIEKMRKLDRQREGIKHFMKPSEFIMYRLKHKSKTSIAVSLMTLWTVPTAALFVKRHPLVQWMLHHSLKALGATVGLTFKGVSSVRHLIFG